MRYRKVLSLWAVVCLLAGCGDAGSGGNDYYGSGGLSGNGSGGALPPVSSAQLKLVFDFTAVNGLVRMRMPSQVMQARVEIYDTTTSQIVHQELVEREGHETTQEVLVDSLSEGVKLVRSLLMDANGTVLGYNDQVINLSSQTGAQITITVMLTGSPPPPAFESGTPGQAVRLGFLVHPEVHPLGQTFTVEVVALDVHGQRVSNASGLVTLRGGGLNPLTVPFLNGVAVFRNLTVPGVGSGLVLSASSGELIPAESIAFQVTPPDGHEPPDDHSTDPPATPTPNPDPTPTPPSGGGGGWVPPPPTPVATSLNFVTVPTTTQTAGVDFEVEVEVRDQFGDRLSGASQALTLGLESSPSMAVLSGQATVNAVDGLATFTINLSKAGSYELSVAGSALTGATSNPLTVQPGAASALAFFVPPAGGTAGVDLTPAPQVEVVDAFGNRVASDPFSITLALAANPTSATLSGSLTQMTPGAGDQEAGVAVFPGLRFDRAGTFSLSASAAGLTGVTSPDFTVAAATATELTFSKTPRPLLTAGVLVPEATVVEARDGEGQRAFDFNGDVTLSIKDDGYTPALGAATGSPMLSSGSATITVAAVQGRATFPLQPNLTGNYVIEASAAGITTSPEATFLVDPGDPATLRYTSEPGDSTYTDVLSRVKVEALDALGNLTVHSAASVSIAASGGTGVLSGTAAATLINGLADFIDLKVGPGPGPASARYKLTATLGSLSLVGSEFLVRQMADFYVDNGSMDTEPQNVAMDSQGNFVVLYSYSGIKLRRYDVDGVLRTNNSEISVSGGSDPAIAMAPDGSFVVVWKTSSQVFLQRYNADGVAQGDPTQVNTGTFSSILTPSVAMDGDGNFVVAWSGYAGNSHVYAQRYNASGVPQGSEFQVSSPTAPGTFTDNRYSFVAMNGAGAFVVVWANSPGTDYQISGQRYNASGVAQGNAFQVSSDAVPLSVYPTAAINSNGNFVVAWTGGDDGINDIYAQRYNSLGVAQDGPLTVSTEKTNYGFPPDVAMDNSGNFLVTWRGYVEATGSSRIYARRYNSTGIAQGPPFLPQSSSGNNGNPSVVMDGSGNAIIAWSGVNHGPTGATGVSGVQARRYPVTP
jgi:hypothetical protein